MYMNSIMKVQHELEVHRSEVFCVLRKIESYATAVDEFNSAINCLENAERRILLGG